MRKAFLILFLVGALFSNLAAQDRPIFDQVMQSIVQIKYRAEWKDIFGQDNFQEQRGTGILLGSNEVLTCYHVLSEMPVGKIQIVAFLRPKTEIRDNVYIKKVDSKRDLLLLGFWPSLTIVYPIVLGKAEPMLGDDIFFIGLTSVRFPTLRFTKYMIGIMGVMVFPAYLGDSGGGVFNMQGELIGILTNMMTIRSDNIIQNTYLGFAVSLKILQDFLIDKK
jgi:hypothetical protein